MEKNAFDFLLVVVVMWYSFISVMVVIPYMVELWRENHFIFKKVITK